MDKNLWLRRLFKAVLAMFCYAQGILTALAFKDRRKDQLFVFMISSFLLAGSLTLGLFFERPLTSVLIRCVSYTFYFASSIMLVIFLSFGSMNHDMQNTFVLHYFHPVILTLILVSMLVVGVCLSPDIVLGLTYSHSSSSTLSNSKSEAAGWHSDLSIVDDLSLNLTQKASTQPPRLSAELYKNLFPEKASLNKDSNGTFVVPVQSYGDDISLSWLVQASMNPASSYDNNLDNWMTSNSFQFDSGKSQSNTFEVVRNNSSDSPYKSSNSPKARVSHSSTTGRLLSPKNSSNHNLHSISLDTTEEKIKVSILTSQVGILSDQESLDNVPRLSIEKKLNKVARVTYAQNEVLDCLNSRTWERLRRDDLVLKDIGVEKDQKNHEIFTLSPFQSQLFENKAVEKTYETNNLFTNERGYIPRSCMLQTPNAILSPSMMSQQYLKNLFDPGPNSHAHFNSTKSFPVSELQNNSEDPPVGTPNWTKSTENFNHTIQNVSIQDSENNKEQWLSSLSDNTSIIFDSALNRASTRSISMTSAPSLHTYRDTLKRESQESVDSFSFSNNKLHKCVTPSLQMVTDSSTHPSRSSSPIKKMIKRLKKKDSMNEIKSSLQAMKRRHSHSIATSMMSVNSDCSNSTGTPRDPRTTYFPTISLDQSHKQYTFSKTDLMSFDIPTATGPDRKFKIEAKIAPERFWDFDNGDYSDRSRVSSVPSAIIGEYDREKWRTMKALQKENKNS